MTLKRDARAALPRLLTPLFLLVMLSTLAYFTAVGMILPTLPRYVEGPLGGNNAAVGVTIGAFGLTAVLLRPFSGRTSDRRGRRILIVGGGLLVGLSIAGYALSASLPSLVFWRLLTGVGEAFYYVGAASVINDLAPDERRGEALSYFSLALFGGLALGPVTGESILQSIGFSWVWIVAGASAAFAGLIGLMVPDTRPAGMHEAPKAPLIHKAALLPGTILATNIWALATFSSFIPLYVLTIGMSGSRFVFALNSAIIIAIRLFGARLPDRLGARKAGTAALATTAVGLFVIALWPSEIALYAGTAIYSIGHALAFPALMTFALSRAPASERGAVVGTFTAFFDFSFGFGAASAGVIAEVLGYRGAFVGGAIVALGGLALLRWAARRSAARRAAEIRIAPAEVVAPGDELEGRGVPRAEEAAIEGAGR
ncbi:MAG: MFS transporter [Actinomycetota bacterium]